MNNVIKLEIKTLVSKLTPLDMHARNMDTLWEHLDTFLSYEIHNSFFMKAMSNKPYIRDVWDGRNHLFNVKNGTFLTGLLPYVQEAITQFQIPCETIDYRPNYKLSKDIPQPSTDLIVRDYQMDAVAKCIKEKRGIIWARPRSGKCINFQSLLFTQQGMITFEEFVGFHKEEKEFPCTIQLFGRQKEVKTRGVYCKGKANTIKLTTRNGFVIEGTPEHPVLIFDEECTTKFRPLGQITKDDFIIIQRGQEYFGNITNLPKFEYKGSGTHLNNYKDCKIPRKMTKKFARLCAYLIAEGCLDSQPCSFTFTNTDKNLISDYRQIMQELFKLNPKKTGKARIDYIVHSIKAKTFLEFLGVKGKAAVKTIPKCIRQAPQKYIAEFLKVFFECAGSVGKNIEISSASAELVRQLQIILLNFGIISKRFPRYNIKHQKNYWRLTITGTAMQIFQKKVGFLSFRKCTKLQKVCNKVKTRNNYDFIPKFRDLVKGTEEYCKLKNILTMNYYFDTVKSIEKAENYVVDFYVPEDNSFFANGFINHNTIMEIILISQLGIYPVLSICQSIDIARQTIEKFKKFLPGVKVGLIGDGKCDIQDVTISTIQSLSAAYNIQEKIPKNKLERTPAQEKKISIRQLVEEAKFVWVDECHHIASVSYRYILQNKIYRAEYILGCSGTPFREDNTNLLIEGLLGSIIYEIDYSKLIDGGYLVRPTIHLIQLPKSVNIDKSAPYATVYKNAVTHNDFRNKIVSKIVKSLNERNKTCMVLVSRTTHGRILAKMMPNAEFSYSKSKDRELLWKRLDARALPCLITTLGDEGIDIVSLDAVIIAAGGESAIKVFQRLRCLTPSDGKNKAIVVDFMDPYKYLSKHSKKRERLYKSESSFVVKYRKAYV